MIESFVDSFIDRECDVTCQRQLPLHLEIENEYPNISVVRDNLFVASPHLLALDESGLPADPFWQALRFSLRNWSGARLIRFAVPNTDSFSSTQMVQDYERLATLFRQQNPDVLVEIVPLDQLEGEPDNWLQEVDGAFLNPTEQLITAGLIHDLTPYVTSAGFDQQNFYEQIWQGGWWRNRMWMMPASAQMNLLYYNSDALTNAGISHFNEPISWAQFTMALDTLSNLEQTGNYSEVFLDPTGDILYSLAYGKDTRCKLRLPCMPALTSANITAAYEWYAQKSVVQNQMVDMSQLSLEEQKLLTLRLTSAQREVEIWVGRPVNFEYYIGLGALGIMSLPADGTAETFDQVKAGLTPLHVRGYVISQSSAYPDLMFQWLDFLTYQPPNSAPP